MTSIEAPVFIDERARWRAHVGLDCPTPAANPRRVRYDGGAELSWQPPSGTPGAPRTAGFER